MSELVLNENILGQLLRQQNALLEQTNKLLEKQNSLLEKNANKLFTASSEEFVEDIWHDEMRSGFLVTSQRKKIWNVQIGLINELARICDKHNIRWFLT